MIFNTLKELNQALPQNGRLIAIDVGTKNIGVAICDSSRTISNPKVNIRRKSNKVDFAIIQKIIMENNVVGVVVGLPINMDSSETKMSAFARRFAENLDQFLGNCKITLFDERLSSFMAEDIMAEEMKIKRGRKKQLIDQIAASVVLQSALDIMKEV
jgi:putative Holliday junction resolvase